jgi:hypothetical protein
MSSKRNTRKNNMAEKRSSSEDEITLRSLYDMVRDGFYRIETDITALKTDVTMLKHNMGNMIKYVKLESKFQELQNRNFISKMYLHNHDNHHITTLGTSKFFNSSGKLVTDLDGFLFIRTYLPTIPQPSSDMISRLPNQTFMNTLRSNRVELNPTHKHHEYIIIESKHSLSKGKVDKKIAQMLEVRDTLRHHNANGVPVYESMIQQIKREINGEELHYPINLIFSSDDISHELREYIIDINKGIDEATYDRHTTVLFYSDPFLSDVIKAIDNNPTIPKKYKLMFERQQPISYIRHAFHDKSFMAYRTEYVSDYLVPFSKLRTTLQSMIGFVGIAQFNTVELPRIFEKSSLNR